MEGCACVQGGNRVLKCEFHPPLSALGHVISVYHLEDRRLRHVHALHRVYPRGLGDGVALLDRGLAHVDRRVESDHPVHSTCRRGLGANTENKSSSRSPSFRWHRAASGQLPRRGPHARQ